MIKTSLFADQEREAKLNQLGDALQVMEQHVDFAALAEAVDLAAPRPGRHFFAARDRDGSEPAQSCDPGKWYGGAIVRFRLVGPFGPK